MIATSKIVLYTYLFLSLFALFFCGSLTIGPLSLRNYSSLLLVVVAFIAGRKEYKIDKVVRHFVIYIILCVIVNIINGSFLSTPFIRMMLVYQLPSIIVLFSLPKLLNDKEDLVAIIFIIALLYVVNMLITYGEYIGNSFAWSIAFLVGLEMPDSVETFEFGSFLAGITGNVVNNGYFLATFLPVVSICIWKDRFLYRLTGYLLLFVAAFVIYIVQQRMAFLSLAFFLFLVFIYKKDKYIIIGTLVLFLYIQIYGNMFSSVDMGRLSSETSNDDREYLWTQFKVFANSPEILFGGLKAYFEKYHFTMQHNAITSSFVIGGIPIFISFVILSYHIFKSIYSHLKNVKTVNIAYVPLCTGCFIYYFYSMTHSQGIQNGAVHFWLLYAIILAYDKTYEFQYRNNS